MGKITTILALSSEGNVLSLVKNIIVKIIKCLVMIKVLNIFSKVL